MDTGTKNIFHSVQLLRGIAALMIVFHHARNPQDWLYNPIPNFVSFQSGVDIFFVVSGFIMFSTARNDTWRDFAIKRIIRIIPLYWLASGVKLIVGLKAVSLIFIIHFVLSILFIPHFSPYEPTQIWPIVIPGWSLNFEMFFYFIFALSLFARSVFAIIPILVILVVIGLFYSGGDAGIITYTSPLLLEFAGGMLVSKFAYMFNRPYLIILSVAGFVLIILSGNYFTINAANYFGILRFLFWGIPALLIVCGFISVEDSIRDSGINSIEIIGNASYGIYLFQEIAISVTNRITARLPLYGMGQFIITVLASIVSAIVIGIVVHYFIEKPIIKYLRNALLPARRRGLAAAS